MNLRRWGAFSAILAAALVGCEQSATEKVQEERDDVVEAEQEVREEQAELNAAEREAREEQPADAGGPILTLPSTSTGDESAEPPISNEPEAVTAPDDAAPTTDEADADPVSEDIPNEGDPQVGTPAEGTGDPPTAGPSFGGEAGSAGEEAGSEGTEPAPPE